MSYKTCCISCGRLLSHFYKIIWEDQQKQKLKKKEENKEDEEETNPIITDYTYASIWKKLKMEGDGDMCCRMSIMGLITHFDYVI